MKWLVRCKVMYLRKGYNDWWLIKMKDKNGEMKKYVLREVDKFYDEEEKE